MSMASLRKQARKQIHKVFSVKMLYTSVTGSSTPFIVTARVNTNSEPTDMGGFGNVGYATRTEQKESLIFNTDEVTPAYGDTCVSIDDGIEYRIEEPYPPYGGYVECTVTRK